MKNYYALASLIISVNLVILSCNAIAPSLDKIDDYLVKKVDDDDVAANLDAAKEWLATGKNLDKSSSEILQKFKLLTKLHEADRCDRNSHAILLANDKATGGTAHSVEPPKSRLARVVRRIAVDHAENCQDVYPKTYSSLIEGMDEQVVSSVKTYMDDVIWTAKAISPFISNEFGIIRMSNEQLWDSYLSKSRMQAFAAIDHLAKGPDQQSLGYIEENDNGLKQARLSHIPEMFQRYLIEPCEQFTKLLGPDVFEPALYDRVLRQSSLTDKMIKDFYVSWAHFRLCEALLKSDNKSLLRDVEKLFAEVRI